MLLGSRFIVGIQGCGLQVGGFFETRICFLVFATGTCLLESCWMFSSCQQRDMPFAL